MRTYQIQSISLLSIVGSMVTYEVAFNGKARAALKNSVLKVTVGNENLTALSNALSVTVNKADVDMSIPDFCKKHSVSFMSKLPIKTMVRPKDNTNSVKPSATVKGRKAA